MPPIAAQLPLPIRALNAALSGSVGRRLLHLDPDRLMQAARKRTGLDDYGSDYFIEPLHLLCRSLEEDAKLTALGRIIARNDILRLLGNRLRFVDIFKRHPEIARQEIVAPVFILGMPRTGTTTLHELMALDPQFRVPLSWEVAHPFPPPETATYRTDPRIKKVRKELAGLDRLLPGFKHMHPMGAELPQECVGLFAHDFMSMIFDVQFCLKQYQRRVIQENMSEVFRNHRRWLQILQWKCPGDTWVLKSPQYLWHIDDMLREYPDARVIHTHRDPVKVALSVGNLTATLRSLGSHHIDLQEATQDYADTLHHGIGKTLSARERRLLNPDREFNVQFSEFRQDPVAAVRDIYNHFGFDLSADTEAAMRNFLDEGKKEKRHGQHTYTLADSGLNLDAERARFADYQRVYGVPSEPVD